MDPGNEPAPRWRRWAGTLLLILATVIEGLLGPSRWRRRTSSRPEGSEGLSPAAESGQEGAGMSASAEPQIQESPPPSAAGSWQGLWARVRAITPSQLAHFVLIAGALGLIGWLVWRNRVSLAPFFVGIVLVYISLPLVDGLDRLLPRWLAILLVMAAELGLFIFLVGTLGPPLAAQIAGFLEHLPTPLRLRGLFEQLVGYLQGLPEPMRELVRESLEPTVARLRENLIEMLRALLDFVIIGLLELANASGFILSFLIVPTWIFAVLLNHGAGLRAVDRLLAPWLRPDFWAVARIVDRPLRAFLGGQVVMGLSVGAISYLALQLIERLGLANVEFPLLLAVVAGLLELIPIVGPLLYVLVAGLAGLTVSPQLAGTLALVALGVQVLANWLIWPRLERRYASAIPPVLLAVAVVIISQVGLLWLLLAGPLTAIAVDLFRYLYGRVADPPRPAGILPGEQQPAPAQPAPASPRRRRWATPARPGSATDKSV
ncbi:MAG: AI-2E family transporter [Chloroflexales bacterium]|nr:AI-2E family transporter [Chloroflexales bacterium]